MRLISLIVVVAIIYMVISRMNSTHTQEVHEAVATAEASGRPANAPSGPATPQAHTDYKRAVDRTRAVVDMAKKRSQE